MRQVSFIGAVLGIVVVAWAFSQTQLAATQSAHKEARKPARDAGQWKYPGSKELVSADAGGGWYARWTTDDDLDKVIAFYGKRFHYTKLTPNKPGGSNIEHQDRWTYCLQDDSVEAFDSKADKNPARPVAVRIFVEHGPWYTLTLVISRAKEDTHTHIAMIFCDPVRIF